MSEFERWRRRERRKELLAAAGAWALLICGALGLVLLTWLVVVFVFGAQ